ncbi:tetratricopeptide repeat protein [Micromonospora sp. LZ34]
MLALLAKAPEDRPADDYDVYQRLLPFLPLPRVDTARLRAQTSTMPDPTLVYRRSNLPRRRPEPAPVVPAPRSETSAADPVAILRTGVRDAIKAAVSQSDELLEDGRFAQAAEVLEQVIGAASAALGAESARVLGLRSRRAAILVIGGDFRRALPEFDALTAASAHTAGPTSEDALECLREAAHCRAELGQATTALRQFRQVLTDVRAASGDASPTALDLRRNIGMLLLSEDKAAEAADALQPLHDDLCVVYGPQHEETREAADVLARLRLAAGEQFRPTPPPHRGRRTSPPWLLPASMISMLPGRHEWSASSLPAC